MPFAWNRIHKYDYCYAILILLSVLLFQNSLFLLLIWWQHTHIKIIISFLPFVCLSPPSYTHTASVYSKHCFAIPEILKIRQKQIYNWKLHSNFIVWGISNIWNAHEFKMFVFSLCEQFVSLKCQNKFFWLI